MAAFTILPATSTDIPTITALFTDYAAWLNLDLTFQSFTAELASLPGKYAPSCGGALFIARSTSSHEALGCVGLRRLSTGEAELKRLWVTRGGRGSGVGRALVQAAIDAARETGYTVIKLDTLRSMEGARRLYAQLGWEETGKYYDTPLEETVFMELRL